MYPAHGDRKLIPEPTPAQFVPSRRTVLGASAAVTGAIAGCVTSDGDDGYSGPAARLTLVHVTDRELGQRIVDDYDLGPSVLQDVLEADQAITTAPTEIVDGAGAQGPDGGYYQIHLESSAPQWSEYAVGFAPDPPAETELTPESELPPVDAAVVATAFDGDGSTYTFDDGTTATAVAKHPFGDAERQRSQLVGGKTAAIARTDGAYGVLVERTTVVPGIATVSATRVAADTGGYGRHLRERHAVELANLSEDERTVVEEAIEDEYETGSSDEALRGVLEKLTDGGADGPPSVDRIARYEGDTYIVVAWIGEGYEPFQEEMY